MDSQHIDFNKVTLNDFRGAIQIKDDPTLSGEYKKMRDAEFTNKLFNLMKEHYVIAAEFTFDADYDFNHCIS